MNYIPCILPSKDRASQLRLLLESVHLNCPNTFKFYVIFRASNENFNHGYEQLLDEIMFGGYVYPNKLIEFIEEKDFYEQCMGIWQQYPEYFGLFTDDTIFYRPLYASTEEITFLLERNPDIFSYTMRLGLNTSLHDYTNLQNGWMKPITKFQCINMNNMFKYIKYNQRDYDPLQNYGYAFHCDGVVYRTQDIVQLLHGRTFDKLRSLERIMIDATQGRARDFVICPVQSCCVCQQINFVQDPTGYVGELVISTEELNKQYLNGKAIDLNSMDFSRIITTHCEIPFSYKDIDYYYEDSTEDIPIF